MVAGAGTQSSRRSAKQFSIRAKRFQCLADLVKKIQLGAQGSRAESPKDNSPGQSESASDALGQPSIKFPSPERAAQNLAGCRPLTALNNKAVLWKDKFLADATASGRDFFMDALLSY